MFPPKSRVRTVSVAIPASIVADTPHLREKTSKIGCIGRALGIFRIDEAVIYPDMPDIDQRKDSEFVAAILSYMETPQYLRKKLVRFNPELRYVGILPPLQLPSHPSTMQAIKARPGDLREGVVLQKRKDSSLIDVGLGRPAVCSAILPVGSRVTLRLSEVKPVLKGEVVSKNEISIYWGYKVTQSKLPLGKMLEKSRGSLIVATSRYGDMIEKLLPSLREAWMSSSRVIVAFGSPREGLREILMKEGIDIREAADFVINTIANQGVQVVRTEEAIIATLALLNILE